MSTEYEINPAVGERGDHEADVKVCYVADGDLFTVVATVTTNALQTIHTVPGFESHEAARKRVNEIVQGIARGLGIESGA